MSGAVREHGAGWRSSPLAGPLLVVAALGCAVGEDGATAASPRAPEVETPEVDPPRESASKSESETKPETKGGVAAVTRSIVADHGPTTTLDMGPRFGGERTLGAVSAGEFRTAVEARQHRFITRERTTARNIRGGAELILGDDGSMRGCFWSTESSRSHTSRFASRDGKDHERESDYESRLGVSGRWEPWPGRAPWARVVIEHSKYRDCSAPAEEQHREAEPIELRCALASSGAPLPSAALVCLVPGQRPELRNVSFVLTDSPRAGALYVWDDPTARPKTPLPPTDQPWLVLGAAPGLRISQNDPSRGPAEFELVAERVDRPEGPIETGR